MDEGQAFTIGGAEVTLSKGLVEEAVRDVEPIQIQRFSVLLNGKRYPIKQPIAAASGQPTAAFLIVDAYRVLRRLGFEVYADAPLPSPDASFAEFGNGWPAFLPTIQDGFECIVNLAMEIDLKNPTPQTVIAMLTGSLADDLDDALVLCSNERRSGATRLLRTPYEKFLYANYIHGHPEAANDFLMFDAIQARALVGGLEKYHDIKITPQGQEGLEAMFKVAQAHFKKTKCKECGEATPRMWTKVTPEEMAKEAGVEDIYVLAYRHATLMIHPSFRGLSDQMKDNLKMPAILFVLFRLTLETLKLQLTFFKEGTAKGRTADVMRQLYDLVAESTTPNSQWEA